MSIKMVYLMLLWGNAKQKKISPALIKASDILNRLVKTKRYKYQQSYLVLVLYYHEEQIRLQ